MSDTAYVTEMPLCDFCKESGVTRKAKYDAKTLWGPWAHMCEIHMRNNGPHTPGGEPRLGTGVGQRLVLGEEPERTVADIRRDVMAAVEAGDWDAFEEAIGDGDPAEYL